MSTDKAAQTVADTELLDPALVEAYLCDHPGFFRNRPDLLAALQLPHGGEGAVSLVERQVSLLRERNIDMRSRLAVANDNAARNERLFAATRAMVLKLIEATNMPSLEAAVLRELRDGFDVSLSALIWFDAAAQHLPVTPADAASSDAIRNLVRHGKSLCGVLRGTEMQALFGGQISEGSAAVAPLAIDGSVVGVIAVGHRDVEYYQAGDGTLFLDYIAEVIERLAMSHRAA